MNKKMKVAIYPYNRKVSSLIRYSDLVAEYDVVSVIVPSGYDATGKDVSVLEKRDNLGVIGEISFDEGIKKCDLLIVAEIDCTTRYKKAILKNVIKAITQGKSIHTLLELEEQEENTLRKLANIYSVKFSSYKDFAVYEAPFNDIMGETYAPIILVAGVNEECQKFDVQLELRKYMQNKGYRISQIGSKHYSEIFGLHSFPEFMYNSAIDTNEKVVGLNAFVRNLEQKEAPDVIIIGVPGGLLPITDKIHQGYGETAFKTGFALQSDACILLVPPLVELELQNLFKRVSFLLGVEPCGVGISNIRYNQEATRVGYQGISLDIIESSEVKPVVDFLRSAERTPVASICDKSDLGELFEYVEKSVKEYQPGIIHQHTIVEKELSGDDSPEKLLERSIYKLFSDLDTSMGIEENWSILKASEILYIIAEVSQKYGVFITAEDICNGVTNNYQNFLKNLLLKIDYNTCEN